MMLTRGGEYAVRCVLYLAAGRETNQVVSKKEVARAMNIPESFMAKVAQTLSRAGIIQITQGARGGYRLLKDPAALSLLQVVEAVDGEIYLNECIMSPESCRRSPFCGVHKIWETARQRLRQTLDEADFATLAREEICGRQRPG